MLYQSCHADAEPLERKTTLVNPFGFCSGAGVLFFPVQRVVMFHYLGDREPVFDFGDVHRFFLELIRCKYNLSILNNKIF
jgi:hypothetical protein